MLKNFNFSTSDLTTCDELQIGDTNLLDQVQQRVWEYYNLLAGEPQKALELSQRALELAANVSDKLLLARSYQNIGAAEKMLGKYDEALAIFQEAQKIYDVTPNAPMRDELLCIKSIGSTYYMKNDFANAYDKHILALNLLDITPELSGNELVRSELLIEVANDLVKLEQKDEAAKNYKEVLEILKGKEQNPRALDLLERAKKGLKELD